MVASNLRRRSTTAISHIPAGKSEKLETLAIGVFDDARLGEESYADAIKEQYHIKLHPQVAGYCTWYSEVGGLTDKAGGAGCSNEKDIATLADFAAKELKPYGFSFVQIDDGWQDGGVFNGPKRGFTRAAPNGAYPHGMKPVAENDQKQRVDGRDMVSAICPQSPGSGI